MAYLGIFIRAAGEVEVARQGACISRSLLKWMAL